MASSAHVVFRPPDDLFVVASESPTLRDLAASLWGPGEVARLKTSAQPIPHLFLVEKTDSTSAIPPDLKEEWSVEPPRYEVRLADHLWQRIDAAEFRADAWVSRALLNTAPHTVSRLLLETPAAVFLGSRSWQVVHAATVVGPVGGVVLRGAADSGKSTLAAAAWARGLTVYGDESVLVTRRDYAELTVAVREIVVRREAAEMLGLTDRGTPIITAEGEHKLRLALNDRLSPDQRRAPLLAVLMLDRHHRSGSARLVPVAGEAFEREFSAGGIPQERWSGEPEAVARAWATRPVFRLEGSSDLEGVVRLLENLVYNPSTTPRTVP